MAVTRLAALTLLLLAVSACQAADWTHRHGADHPFAGAIVDLRSQRVIDEAALLAALGNADIVLLGETHDNRDHHLLQARLVGAMGSSVNGVVFEMIDTGRQEAVVEHLHEVVRCRGLFATHYHELTALAAKLDHLAPHHARVKEWKGEVVFLHEIAHGSADRSYGIHVARLAGLPPVVVERAQAVLETLEAGEARAAPARLAEDLPLFRAVLERRTPERKRSPLEAMLDELDPDRLTPREALERLYALKRACDETG